LLAATVVNQTDQTNIEEVINSESQEQEIILETETEDIELKQENMTTEEIVKEYFIDSPVMADIAFCESRFRQFDKNGNPLRGVVNSADVGVMQINEKYHAGTAAKLGINIYTLEGNMEYGMYLYETQGTDPWVHSKPCWNTVREIAINN
jgi:hypothetical protein